MEHIPAGGKVSGADCTGLRCPMRLIAEVFGNQIAASLVSDHQMAPLQFFSDCFCFISTQCRNHKITGV